MKAAVYYGQKDIKVEDIESPKIHSDEVKVKVAWIGICGSDLHEYLGGPINASLNKENPFTKQKGPFPLGHEFSGTVSEVGKDIKEDLKVGDRVVVNPMLTLDNQEADFDATEGVASVGFARAGGYAEYVNVPATTVIKIGDDMSLKHAALVEPTAVSVQAIKEANIQFGQTIAIIGAGPIGLSTLLVAKSAGAKSIVVMDLSEERLELAKSMGATAVYNTGELDSQTILKQQGLEQGFDVTFEVAGVAPTFKQSIEFTKKRGRVIILSIFAKDISWNPLQLTKSWVNIYPTLGYSKQTFKDTVKLIHTGQIKSMDMVTSQITLDEVVEKGFEALANNKKHAKILVEISGEE